MDCPYCNDFHAQGNCSNVFQITAENVWNAVVVANTQAQYLSGEELDIGLRTIGVALDTCVGKWPMSYTGMDKFREAQITLRGLLAQVEGKYNRAQLLELRKWIEQP